ncbi:hypothetical protein MKX01_017707, partial [Papaver californicum]
MTPCAPQAQSNGASKTFVTRSLQFSMNKYDLVEFFKHAGEAVDAHYKDVHYKGT